jgi:glycosyltransferase involved in cell wall biosynthesis
LRILQVISSLQRGGAERVVLDLSKKLAELGHDVRIVQLRPETAYSELDVNITITVAPSCVYYSVLGTDKIDISNFESVVDSFAPNIIHSHLIDSELVSRNNPRKGIAYITHWHGCPNLTNPVPFKQRLSREFVWKWNTKRILLNQYKACQNHFICISNFIGDYVKANLNAGKTDITIVHNAIDITRFRPLNQAKSYGFRLINIASLHKNKNHKFLFEVVRTLIDHGLSDVYMDVYGEGPELESLGLLIQEMNLSDHVKLLGVVDDIEIQMNKSHLLVHSAWHEPFGLIFIEAMACGIPVVSFKTGGPAELINDGENGYLIEKDDLNGFVEKVKYFYHNREQLDVFGKRGIESAAKFGLDDYAKKIEAVYTNRLAEIRK